MFQLSETYKFYSKDEFEITPVTVGARGHSIITFALRGRGGGPQNANKSERGGGRGEGGVLA